MCIYTYIYIYIYVSNMYVYIYIYTYIHILSIIAIIAIVARIAIPVGSDVGLPPEGRRKMRLGQRNLIATIATTATMVTI